MSAVRLLLVALLACLFAMALGALSGCSAPADATADLVVSILLIALLVPTGLFFRSLSRRLDREMAETRRSHEEFMARVRAFLERKAP